MSLGAPARVMAAFALHALPVGALFARLPEIQHALQLSEETYGLALMGMPAGVLLATVLSSSLIGRVSPKWIILIGHPLNALLTLAVIGSGSAAGMAAALALFGFAFAFGNVSINVEADRVEAAHGVRVMSRCHAWWAVGFLAVSLASAGCVALKVPPAAQLAGTALVVAALAALVIGPYRPSPPRGGLPARRFAVPSRTTAVILGFALAGVVLEHVTRGWAVIYLRDVHGAPEALAALALPVIVALTTAGRFLGDRWSARLGDAGLGRALALTTAAGVTVAVLAPSAALALLGLAAVGLGISTTMPQATSAAARLGTRPAAEGVAAFLTVQTAVGFVSPSLFGFLAGTLSLRWALLACLPLTLLAFRFARHLGERRGDAGHSTGNLNRA